MLLGLVNFHTSRDVHLPDKAKLIAYQDGISHIQTAFRSNHNIASAAAVLASHFLTASNWAVVSARFLDLYASLPTMFPLSTISLLGYENG